MYPKGVRPQLSKRKGKTRGCIELSNSVMAKSGNKGAAMRKILLLSALLSTAWLAAQSNPSQNSSQSSSTGKQTTVQGCLSGPAGNYMLTDNSGNIYHLTGDTSKLRNSMAHTVAITGTVSRSSNSNTSESTSPSGSNGTSSSSSGSKAQQILNVSSVTDMSRSCMNTPQ